MYHLLPGCIRVFGGEDSSNGWVMAGACELDLRVDRDVVLQVFLGDLVVDFEEGWATREYVALVFTVMIKLVKLTEAWMEKRGASI